MFFQVFTYKYCFFTIFLDLICFYSLDWWIIGRKSIEWVILEDDHHRARVESTPTLLMSHIFPFWTFWCYYYASKPIWTHFKYREKYLKKRKLWKIIKIWFQKIQKREKQFKNQIPTVLPMLELQLGGPRPGVGCSHLANEVNIVFNDYFARLRGILCRVALRGAWSKSDRGALATII